MRIENKPFLRSGAPLGEDLRILLKSNGLIQRRISPSEKFFLIAL